MKRIPTPAGVDCGNPIWSPNGSQIAYWQVANSQDDGVYVAPIDGSSAPRRLASRPTRTASLRPCSWSPDGTTLIAILADSGTGAIVSLPASSKNGELVKPVLLRKKCFAPTLSPDGRCLAYGMAVGGRPEVFVSGWDGANLTGQPIQISSAGGFAPTWAREGRRLYYATDQDKLVAVDIRTDPILAASSSREVGDLGAWRITDELYDSLPGGRILGIQRAKAEDVPTHAEIVLNFTQEVEERLRTARK